MTSGPIGVFDSGVGGLSVARAIRQRLPHEDLLYLADTACVPYGDRPESWIEARSAAIAELLVHRHAKAIVVACNTATAAAVRSLRARFEVPIVAIEPAVKVAAETTRAGVVAVLATTRTLSSENFRRLQGLFGEGIAVFAQPCPGLADRVEAGDLSGPATRGLLEKYVRPAIACGADTIVLGCTHYSFLTGLIAEIAGPHVTIVDPAPAVARQLERRLTETRVIRSVVPISHLDECEPKGTDRFLATGPIEHARRMITELWLADGACRHEVEVEFVAPVRR
ncbi:glutamate racemase [Pendulispora rubella]|uniref:Glutamate racemase n=1 Tax=Pendulispora rubella TaxID=2741070 RepID=A0ABZ2KZP3_9BACT